MKKEFLFWEDLEPPHTWACRLLLEAACYKWIWNQRTLVPIPAPTFPIYVIWGMSPFLWASVLLSHEPYEIIRFTLFEFALLISIGLEISTIFYIIITLNHEIQILEITSWDSLFALIESELATISKVLSRWTSISRLINGLSSPGAQQQSGKKLGMTRLWWSSHWGQPCSGLLRVPEVSDQPLGSSLVCNLGKKTEAGMGKAGLRSQLYLLALGKSLDLTFSPVS